MPCYECEKAISSGYAYWCSICSTFIPSTVNINEVIEEPIIALDPNADTKDRAGIILINKLNQVLLVRGPTGKLSLPKGKRKVCETDYEAACRECLEESGVDVRGMYVIRKETIQDVVYFYVSYTGPLDALLGSVNHSEITEVSWWNLLADGISEVNKNDTWHTLLHEKLVEESKKGKCNHSLDTLLRKRFIYKVCGKNLSHT
jgi:8-oxo-dGTP pyrophosphatase MutT (NUDIX family)